MKITKLATDESILGELGKRLAEIRLAHNFTQGQLAEEAGVSKRTVERLESGSVATQLSSFLRIVRILGILERFDLLIPESLPSPIELLKQQGRKRRRASSREIKKTAKEWRWGDEK
jgi:transcriptional regulator with XRE-family HTH domain